LKDQQQLLKWVNTHIKQVHRLSFGA
jgi:hypothetical protein